MSAVQPAMPDKANTTIMPYEPTDVSDMVPLEPEYRLDSEWVREVGTGDRDVRTLADRLAFCRLVFGKTQKEIANSVWIVPKSGTKRGVRRPLSRNSFAQYEQGVAEPPRYVIIQLAKLFNVSPGWLTFGDEGTEGYDA